MPSWSPEVAGADRLVLGTVQFGLGYGISHNEGAIPVPEIRRILDLAWRAGVRVLDTAAAYGMSEQIIGSLDVAATFDVITKTVPIRADEVGEAEIVAVERGVRASLENLRRPCVHALLVHNIHNLRGQKGAELWARLERLRAEGAAVHLGISVYDVSEAEEAAERFPIEIVQLPLNVFDQRAVAGGGLERLASRGVVVHARSVFLQGLLLMEPRTLPPNLRRAEHLIQRWRDGCVREGVSPLAAALHFVLAQASVAKLVVGLHSHDHLASYLQALAKPVSLPWASYACEDPAVIDPRAWSKVWTQ